MGNQKNILKDAGKCTVDEAIAPVGEKAWRNFSPEVRKKLLFDRFCPAGGTLPLEHDYDGSRYFWPKEKR